jgi:hypothetical protein
MAAVSGRIAVFRRRPRHRRTRFCKSYKSFPVAGRGLSGRFVAFRGPFRDPEREPMSHLASVDSRGGRRGPADWERHVPLGEFRRGWPASSGDEITFAQRSTHRSRGSVSVGRSRAQRVVTFPAYGAFSQPLLEKCFNRFLKRSTHDGHSVPRAEARRKPVFPHSRATGAAPSRQEM